ncbi:hypothetical protein HVA01_06940 [Halovibrio variabilis]|uniref:Uncharacterized protein n=1 Tax=Halovibrio variabilis TaxID=31910 RepID=A0A511UN08_9GAMM|nr:hypothetical protein HVA01_06940 [Halovibrio variabilis]
MFNRLLEDCLVAAHGVPTFVVLSVVVVVLLIITELAIALLASILAKPCFEGATQLLTLYKVNHRDALILWAK